MKYYNVEKEILGRFLNEIAIYETGNFSYYGNMPAYNQYVFSVEHQYLCFGKCCSSEGTGTPVITGYQRSEMPILRCLNKMSITDKSDAHFSIIYPKRLLAFVKD